MPKIDLKELRRERGFAKEPKRELPSNLNYDDFLAYKPQNNFIFVRDGSLWPAASVNGSLNKRDGMKPSNWLHRHQAVEQMTWAPGEPALIKDKLIIKTGWIESKGITVYNLYRPPHIVPGDPAGAEPWVQHNHYIYPDDADYFIRWFAYRVQHPDIKINHALFLGGSQGVGKDTLLEPVLRAVGDWNCNDATPTQIASGRFNGYRKSVILRVNEARDLGEVNRPQFYEATKILTVSPPFSLPIDEKNTHEYYVPNIVGVIITSNHKAGGIYLPAEDRRHYVAWSPRLPCDLNTVYFDRLWAYFNSGGYADIAAYLRTLDVRDFNPAAPPPHTQSFKEIINSSRAPEDSEIGDVLETMGWPDAVTVPQIERNAEEDLKRYMQDRNSRKIIPRRLEAIGYVAVSNPTANDGRWLISGRKLMVYAKATMPFQEQLTAIRKLMDEGEWYASGA